MRAACVCVKSRNEQEVRYFLDVRRDSNMNDHPHLQFRFLTFSHFQVLLVSGTRGWIIPGGKVEPMEVDDPSFAAVREAREEGGVRGEP